MNCVPSLYNNNLLQLHHATQKQTPEDLNTLYTTLTVNHHPNSYCLRSQDDRMIFLTNHN